MQSVVVQYALLGMGVLLLSTSAIFVKMAEAPSGIIAFYRLLFTLAFLVPALLARKKEREQLVHLNGRQLRLAVISGALLAVHWVMWFESLRYTSVASSTVLVSLQPLFSILFGALFLKERVSKWGMVGVFLAIFGSAIIGWGSKRTGRSSLYGSVLYCKHRMPGHLRPGGRAILFRLFLPDLGLLSGAGAVCHCGRAMRVQSFAEIPDRFCRYHGYFRGAGRDDNSCVFHFR